MTAVLWIFLFLTAGYALLRVAGAALRLVWWTAILITKILLIW